MPYVLPVPKKLLSIFPPDSYTFTSASCEGGALPVIMSITGPRETHDYCVLTSECQVQPNPKPPQKKPLLTYV